MSVYRKTVFAWLAGAFLGITCLVLFANDNSSIASLLLDGSSLLIGIVCLVVFLKEPSRSNKPIFLNFAVLFFLSSILSFSYKFIGTEYAFFSDVVRYYFYQYHVMAYHLMLAFAVLYVVIDSFFNDIKTRKKYMVTLLIAGGTFAFYYYPLLENPKYLGTTEEWRDFTAISNSVAKLKEGGNQNPTSQEIAAITDLAVWRDGVKVGNLFEEQKLQRVNQILPYLSESNSLVLVYKPLYLNNIYMNTLCIVFIFLFFGYQYKNDPPQGAYIEKIIFLFLPYCSLEILHHYAYIKSVEYSTFEDVQQIGIYLTLVNMALLLVFFGLRLRFITSVKGEFYERELVSDAEHISRWRDAFDNLVVRHFLDPKAVHGRLFAPRSPRGEA
jgi:hypothetical protein